MTTILMYCRGLGSEFYVDVTDDELEEINVLLERGALSDTERGRDLTSALFDRPRAKGPKFVLYYV